MENGPVELREILDETMAQSMLKGTLFGRFMALRSNLRDTLDEVFKRHARVRGELLRRGAKPEQIAELEREALELEQHHQDEYRRKLKALLEQAHDEAA